jgi:glycosyltransferase involved in cell wall biosynthesis
MSPAPRFSIAIACVNGLPYIEECLASFERQAGGISFEVIVADRCNSGCREVVRRHPRATLIEVDRPAATIPELRALAIRRARGEVVGITEDHCIAPEGWLAAMKRAHDEGHRIVGGPIENAATRRLVDWAVFFCEYSAFQPPLPAGPGPVPGNNTTYERTLLTSMDDLLDRGVWEEDFNTRLAKYGHTAYVEPAAIMLHKKSFGVREFMAQRYHYARSYAGLRLRRARLWRRPIYAGFAASFLPPMLLARIIRNVWARRRQRRELALSLPLLALFVATWGWGEAIGYLFGAGESLAKVE